MADSNDNYGSTLAPLIVKDLVIAGVSGGDEGIRGFLAAYKADSGQEAWRFWTVPLPGEPLSETWDGGVLPHGCAATWLTGTYDPELNLLYWPTGNPCPDMNGDERSGDNLYSDSMLALEPETGKLRWYYQYTPHDLNDWDSNQTPAADRRRVSRQPAQTAGAGQSQRLLLRARPDQRRSAAGQAVRREDELGKRRSALTGGPCASTGAEPMPAGTKICPSMAGATNWMSAAYNPQTGLVYVQATEQCDIYTKRPEEWQRGQSFYAGGSRSIPDEPGSRHLRALRLETGEIAWSRAQTGPNRTWGGVLSTAGGLVFYGDDSGAFVAVDATDGKALWHFQTNEDVEGFADDLRGRRQAVCCGGFGERYHRVCAAGRDRRGGVTVTGVCGVTEIYFVGQAGALPHCHSCRKAVSGSTWAAQRAGASAATSATTATTARPPKHPWIRSAYPV